MKPKYRATIRDIFAHGKPQDGEYTATGMTAESAMLNAHGKAIKYGHGSYNAVVDLSKYIGFGVWNNYESFGRYFD